MNAAISQLQIYYDTLSCNEPINRSEGNIDQANLQLKNKKQVSKALEILGVFDKEIQLASE